MRFVLALAIIAGGGYVAYTTYYTPLESVETAQPVGPTPAPTVPLPVPLPQAAAVAAVTIPEPTAAEETIDVNGFNPAELKSIADVAAMLPDTTQQPLPTQAVRVDAGDSPAALSKRAMALQGRGAHDAAIMLYDEAGAAGGDAFSTRVNKWGLVAVTEPARAVSSLRNLVAERPRDAAARAQLGIALVKLGKTAEARTELEKAAALAPETTSDSAQVWYNLGVMYDTSHDRDAAIIAYEKAINGAVTNNQQDLLDISAVQRRLNYLRATPTKPDEQAPEPIADNAAAAAPTALTDGRDVP